VNQEIYCGKWLLSLAQRGATVFAPIRERRILRGAELLRESDVGIAEIALAIGFSNAGNFATAFRERMGVTPGAYRRSAKAGGGNA
jgi:AraC-like DNA-binding protein